MITQVSLDESDKQSQLTLYASLGNNTHKGSWSFSIAGPGTSFIGASQGRWDFAFA